MSRLEEYGIIDRVLDEDAPDYPGAIERRTHRALR
jgi:hypothetical protein